MGLGVLDDRKLEHVPGTAFLQAGRFGDEAAAASVFPTHAIVNSTDELLPGIKYDLSGERPIILIPQPSDDPNDPLNWSLRSRDLITFILCLISVVAATLGPLLAANTVTLSLYWKHLPTDVALLTGYHLLGVGVAGIFFVPSARLWGKRHLYILGTVLLIFSSIWGGAARSYKSLLWARVFQGIAIAPFEALVNASVGDLYPVHLRGTRMAFTNFALFGGAFFTPVIVGKMTETMFWRWPFYFVAIFAAIFAPLVFLFVPETSYRRKVDTDSISTNNLLLRTAVDPNFDDSKQSEDRSDNKSTPTPQRKRDSFLRRLRLFNGRKTDANLIQLLIRPFPLLFHPAIIWGMLIQGVMIGWTVMIGVVLGLIFMLPPLWFSETEVGYMYSGAFFGATIGFILSGILSDFSAKWLAKINNGVYEPEFRIILVIPQLVIGAAGLFGFGWYSEHVTLATKFVPSVFFGLEVMGMVLGATGSALYLVDSYREVAVEAFTCLLIFKNFFSYVLTYYAVDWVQVNGPWKLFQTIGIIQIGICLLSVPMYIYGKKIRSFTHRHEIMKRISWLNVNEK